MGRKAKPNYTREFKEDVLDYYKNNNYTKSEVAEKFGMHVSSLSNWLKAEREYKTEAFIGSGNLRTEDAQIKAKDRKIRDLEEENAILKKAMAIFSRKP